MLFSKIESQVLIGVIGSRAICRWFSMLLGLLFFAMSTFGMVENSLALTAGVTCTAVEDNSDDEIISFGEDSASQALTTNPDCQEGGTVVDNSNNSSFLSQVVVLLNTNNDGTPLFWVGLRIDYRTASITEVRVDGVLYATGTAIGAAITANAFTHTVQYKYAGNTYSFVTSKDAASNTLKAFTVQLGAVSNIAPIIAGGANTAVNVVENQTAVTDVQSSDDIYAEGSGLIYTLSGGADQAKFAIDANTGVLTFVTAPNFEAPTDAGGNNIYDVQVTVTDSGGLVDVQDIAVTVTDVDEVAPDVTILGAPSSIDGVTSFDITVQFNKDVTGFVLADITVGNGTASNFVAADANTYIATITPSGKGDVTLDVAANVAIDGASNGNEAATQVVVRDTTVEDTQKVIATFMHNRAYHLLANQPKISFLLNGPNLRGGGPLGELGVAGNESNVKLSFTSSLSRLRQNSQSDKRIDDAFPVDSASSTYGETHNFDIWTEIYGSSSRAGNADSDLWVGYIGAHYFVSPDMIVGALLQVDWASEINRTANTSAEGTGWMVGPYIAGKIRDSKISYEARVAWGHSDNEVTPIGIYTDEFETERFLASGKISGSYRLGNWTIVPQASVSWFDEQQKAYTDTLGNIIPKQTISLGEYSFGPSFTYDIKLEDGTLVRPSFGISGIQNFGIKKGILTQGAVLGSDELRARLDAGVTITNLLGWNIALTGFYDGVGIDNYNAYGGSAKLVIPLN